MSQAGGVKTKTKQTNKTNSIQKSCFTTTSGHILIFSFVLLIFKNSSIFYKSLNKHTHIAYIPQHACHLCGYKLNGKHYS